MLKVETVCEMSNINSIFIHLITQEDYTEFLNM
jgi:hypothetical protein